MKYTIFVGLLLAGCSNALSTAPTSDSSTNAPDMCNASAHQRLIGLDAASALALPEPKRLAGPHDVVTTDFNPARLNVGLDDTDTILSVTCG